MRLWGRHGRGLARVWWAVLVLAQTWALAWAQVPEPGVAAKVNGVEISVFRLERHFEDFLKERGRNVGTLRSPVAYKRLKREALDELIDRELLWQAASRAGRTADPEALAVALKRSESAFKGREAYLRRLQAAGFDEASYADYMRRTLAGSAMHETLVDEALLQEVPSDEELRAIYRGNQARFVRPEQWQARHILLSVPPEATPAVREAARQRAEELLAKLRAGADFAELARTHSQDGTAVAGGDLGWFARGRMVPRFEQAVLALQPGELAGPVATEFGWHLIRLEAQRPGGAIGEDEAVPLIRRQVLDARREAVARQVLQTLRTKATIEYLLSL